MASRKPGEKSFAEQLAERTQPYFNEVVVNTVDNAKVLLEKYFDEVAVDRSKDLNDIHNTLDSYRDQFKKINDKLSYLIKSESGWNSEVIRKLSNTKRDESKLVSETVERSVISKIGEEDKSFAAGKVSVIQIVSDIRGRLDKASEGSSDEVKEVVENFSKSVLKSNNAVLDATTSLFKKEKERRDKEDKKREESFFKKLLRALGILFIGLAFKEKISSALKDAWEGWLKDSILTFIPGAKQVSEKYNEWRKDMIKRGEWGVRGDVSEEMENRVLSVPKSALPEVSTLLKESKPKLRDYESVGEWWKARRNWKTEKGMVSALEKDWYKYHPEDLPEMDVPSDEVVKADLWAIQAPLPPALASKNAPNLGYQVDPSSLYTSQGFFYTEFAKTKQAQDIRERHKDDSFGPLGMYRGTMYNPSFQKEFKQAFDKYVVPYLEQAGGNWGRAVEIYTNTIVDNNKNPVTIH